MVFADRIAVIDGAGRWTYGEFADRCLRQAGMLADLGLQPGDRVAVLAPNTHVMLESSCWSGRRPGGCRSATSFP